MHDSIFKAVAILKRGGLVAFPTETVYGLAADATNDSAIKKIFAAKGRPINHPLIVHIGTINQLSDWAMDISLDAMRLAQHFWPGPLTLILKKAPAVSNLITGGQDSIGLRIPNHPVALALLNTMKVGLAAPSANRFGRISPTTAEAVREELKDKVDDVLEGGHCEVGLESTIVDMRGAEPILLRPGMITVKQLEKVLGKKVLTPAKKMIRVSGNLESHYAPQTPLQLVSSEALLSFYHHPIQEKLPCALVTRQPLEEKKDIYIKLLGQSPEEYAYSLYETLRELDNKKLKIIIVEDVPDIENWSAIHDRLSRARTA